MIFVKKKKFIMALLITSNTAIVSTFAYDPYVLPMPTTDETIIIFYRHGETETNAKKLVCGGGRGNDGVTDLSLNEKGRKQAEDLGDRFSVVVKSALARDISPEVISPIFYASHLKRVKETAQIVQKKIAQVTGLRATFLIEDEDLREKDSGIIEGLPNTIKKEYHHADGASSDAWETSNAYWDKSAIPGEETPNELLKRTLGATNKIVQANKWKIVFIATSGKLMRRFAAHAMDMTKLPCPVENGTAFFARYNHETKKYTFLKAASLSNKAEYERSYREEGMPEIASIIN